MLSEMFLSLPYVSVALEYGRTSLAAGGAYGEQPSPSCASLRNTGKGLQRIKY